MGKNIKRYALSAVVGMVFLGSNVVSGSEVGYEEKYSTSTEFFSRNVHQEEAWKLVSDDGLSHDEFFQQRVDFVAEQLAQGMLVSVVDGVVIVYEKTVEESFTRTNTINYTNNLHVIFWGNSPPTTSQSNQLLPTSRYANILYNGVRFSGFVNRTNTPSWQRSVVDAGYWRAVGI